MPNFSTLLFTTTEEDCFLDELNLAPDELARIDGARKDIREALKADLPRVLREKGLDGDICPPRFYIQGSRSYKTLNSPCTTPPQQSDIDDGVYLPLSVMREETSPKLAIALFFDAVVDVLDPICAERNWQTESKDTCVRVTISPYAHIDLPLYVIPDTLFLLIKSNMENRGQVVFDSAINSERDTWKTLPSDRILLADRNQGWRKSDPMAMKNWFKQECQDKGPDQLIRVVRYLKAFRDKQWEEKGPSSILLMAMACQLFESIDKRDDRALLNVVKGIPAALQNGVMSPIDPEASLTAHMPREAIADAVEKFQIFATHLEGAINSPDAETACVWLLRMLGNRFPNAPHRMKSNSDGIPAPMAAIAPLAGPAEPVKRTKAG
ncbi:CBASS cGAMP synthase [Pseudomonas sp. AM8]|uniref:CBASS cGAMP synthase n=1 Tax=Pseudomonas sp. AM8 TaxID=2983368 RepID=UPI002E81F3B1|nr:CBASS cGAMP synthase [Pseudomonas sp. AM8]